MNRLPLGELARLKKLCVLVSLFHGHTHNRLCQLQHLGTYLMGLGLEDLETLEHFFSKSNSLASGIRYASRFHRRQRITWYLKHIDRFESFEHLSRSLHTLFMNHTDIATGSFLCNNNQQALEIIESYPVIRLISGYL